jgi:uncharacterized protein
MVTLVTGCVIVAVMAVGAGGTPAARAGNDYQTVPYSLVWNENHVVAENNWSSAPGITGYTGADDNLSGTTRGVGYDPQLVVEDLTAGQTPVVHANELNQGSPTPETYAIVEFHPTTGGLTKAMISMHANSKFDAPFLLFHLNTTGKSSINIQYNVIDIDFGATNAVQRVALQYRVGSTGPFTNVPAGYIADATDDPAAPRKVTPINATLPDNASNKSQVQFRVITTNASGADEFIAVDNIAVSGTTGGDPTVPPPTEPPPTPDPELTEKIYLPQIVR